VAAQRGKAIGEQAMKLTFSNLGTIKKTELDLRPLTVIIGPNNSSKTYLAYSIYGIWQSAWEVPANQWFAKLRWKDDKTGTSLALDDHFVISINRRLENLAHLFSKELNVFFQDSSHKLFAEASFLIQADQDEILQAAERLFKSKEIAGQIQRGVAKFQPVSRWMEDGTSLAPPGEEVKVHFGLTAVRALLPRPFLLPAERNALVITYKMLANRRYKLMKDRQRESFGKRTISKQQGEILRGQGDIRYPKPIEDFLDFLTDLDLLEEVKLESERASLFQGLANVIERTIQNRGKIRFRATVLGGRELKIDVKRGLSIDLYNASSSIKQLTPLLLYLRYRAKTNDFLIIDEPEMNLHPEAQAKLLEVLGILVNLGVRVLLTTHSPYFMSHLNNLVAGTTANPAILKKQASSLYLGDPRAFLTMDQVGAYEMKDNELRSLKDEDYGIRWDTLSDVSVELQQKFFEIHQKGSAGHG
jgi:hypothetical protein